jgi:phosphonate transport system permease protein
MVVDRPRRAAPVGARAGLVLAILAAFAWAVWQLDLRVDQLIPHGDRLNILGEFFLGALTPDLSGLALREMLRAVWNTIVFATAAMVFAMILGMALGFLSSTAWWSDDGAGPGSCPTCVRCTLCPAVYVFARLFIALFRSIHELFWAILLLIAMGVNPFSGVVAIAIPYGCTLAKVFSEMVDEAPRDSAIALRAVGASSMQVYCFGLLTRALPDMTAYAFYRFECTLRSAAILGFFGFETLGYFIRAAFLNPDPGYGTTWTFLYGLLALVIAADWWSGAFRRSFAR